MVGIIVSSCLAALVLVGLIVFIYKSALKASDDVKKTDGDKVVSNENEKDKTKEVTQEINKVANKKISVDDATKNIMKDVKSSEEKDKLIKGIDGLINGNKTCIDLYDKNGDEYNRISKLKDEIANLNKLKTALIDYKI